MDMGLWISFRQTVLEKKNFEFKLSAKTVCACIAVKERLPFTSDKSWEGYKSSGGLRKKKVNGKCYYFQAIESYSYNSKDGSDYKWYIYIKS